MAGICPTHAILSWLAGVEAGIATASAPQQGSFPRPQGWSCEFWTEIARAAVLYDTPLVETQGDRWREGLRRAERMLGLVRAR